MDNTIEHTPPYYTSEALSVEVACKFNTETRYSFLVQLNCSIFQTRKDLATARNELDLVINTCLL